MPLYRFTVNGSHSIVQPDTVDLPDRLAARQEGIRRAGAALVLDARGIDPSGDWSLDVTDQIGTLLFHFDFTVTEAPAAR